MKLFFLLSTLNLAFASILPRANNLVPTVSSTDYLPSPAGGGTYPRLAHLADGSVLAGFTATSGTTHILTVTRSTDGARTWSSWGIVATGSTVTADVDNLDLIQLANGAIIATFRNHDKTSAGVYTFYRITACVSHDNGVTWTFLSQVDQRTASGVNGLWEPFMRVANSGALQVYYAAENNANDQDILMRSSTDNGATWSAALTVAGGSTTGRDGMPSCTDFTTSAGSRLLCVFETTEGTAPLFTIKSVVSTNDGVSFAERAQVYVPTGSGNNAGAPSVVTTTPTGTLVVSFMTDEDNTAANTWPSGASMKILTSLSTDPAVWGHKTTVLGISSFWPSVYRRVDGSGTVVACADMNGVRCREVTFA
ncbi:glycoside hydrolase family 93 protein [Mycena epipterygia]|nr:glycoside hydrolase family 93 protein [Mycena epipterygia]